MFSIDVRRILEKKTFAAYTGQIVKLSSGCNSKGSAEHEILHALGFYHEQNRPDRDQYVTIHHENVMSGKFHNTINKNNTCSQFVYKTFFLCFYYYLSLDS